MTKKQANDDTDNRYQNNSTNFYRKVAAHIVALLINNPVGEGQEYNGELGV